MKILSHSEQQRIWEEEHKNPYILLPMDGHEPSLGILLFWEWLQQQNITLPLSGIEMGCGKGRNSIWLAHQGISMTAFDFSKTAIQEAKRRSDLAFTKAPPNFILHDATTPWPFNNQSMDIAIDCFASTDIESLEGRSFARDEFKRLLKPEGFLLVYTLSTKDLFHQEMRHQFSTKENNAFLHPSTGKFEKVFDREELLLFYQGWTIVAEKCVPKITSFFGKNYPCEHFWFVLKK